MKNKGLTYSQRVEVLKKSNHKLKDVMMESYTEHINSRHLGSSIREHNIKKDKYNVFKPSK